MAKENAKKFLEKAMKDEALREVLAGKTAEEATAEALAQGFEVTEEELVEAVKELRQEGRLQLSDSDLEKVSGGSWWQGEDAPDGHEMGCILSYHGYSWSKKHDTWCESSWYCKDMYWDQYS